MSTRLIDMILTAPGRVSPHFRAEEFACKGGLACCNGTIKVSQQLIEMLEKTRDLAGFMFEINSGYRCSKHNVAINGSMNSAHLRGYAADIKVVTDAARMDIVSAAVAVGFRRIGIGKTFVHLDCDPTLRQDVLWIY